MSTLHEEVNAQQAQARLKEVVGSLPPGYEGRIRAHSARARQIFRNPDHVMLQVSGYYSMLAKEDANDYWINTGETAINTLFDIASMRGVSDPDGAWRALTETYPPVQAHGRVDSPFDSNAKHFMPILEAAPDKEDMIRRIVAFGRLRLPCSRTLLTNFDAIGLAYARDMSTEDKLETMMDATGQRVLDRVGELRMHRGMGVDFLRAAADRPEAVELYFKVRDSGYNPVRETDSLLAARKNVSLVVSPETGLIVVGDMARGHEQIADDFGIDPASYEYRKYLKGSIPRRSRRGPSEPTVRFGFGFYELPEDVHRKRYAATDAVRGCLIHMAEQGFDPNYVVKVSDAAFFSRCGYRLGNLIDEDSFFGNFNVDPTDWRGSGDWTCMSGNGIDIWRYNMSDDRVLGNTVIVSGKNVYTGDVPVSTLGGSVEFSTYCAAHTREDGSISLSGRIPKHESHAPSPSGVADVMRRFDPNLKIEVSKVTGKRVN
ncbi:MAG: hypothetical protein ABIH11_07980 [Candidatus Altiarchaeota archaeon]